MILKVNKDICEIKQNEVWNVGDYNVHTVQVELSPEFNGLVNKVRYFVEDNSYDMLITDNVAQVPYEATIMEGTIKIGVYGYDADTDILVQSTSPVNKYIASGTYTGEADNTEPLTPTDKEQMETAIQKNTDDITDLKANKQDKLISGVNIKTINNESILSSGNLTLVAEETDPIFTNSPAYSITDEDITYWNNKANMSDIPDVSNFITKDVDDLTYYTKSTDMQIAINNAVGNERTAIQKNADDITDLKANKQDTLISGTNIKTINNTSLLGEGNITIEGGGGGGTSDYADLSNKPKINNVELNGNKSLNDLGIQPVGNYALESDMTEAQNDIEALQTENERLKATLPTTTGEGENVTLDKTAEMEFVKPPLPRGNTKQDTTTGKNLLKPEGSPATIRGVSWSYREDGAVVGTRVSSNENASDFTLINSITFQPGSYIFSCFDSESTPGASKYQSNISINGVNHWGTGNYSFVLNEVSTIRVVLRVYPNFTGTAIFKPMIRLSSIQESNYEPYTGGQPSPSPDYPQEIRNVTGNVEVTISNENNTESKTLPVSLGNIELCKIGNYQDYLYKNNGKWYKYNAIKKLVLNGSENWASTTANGHTRQRVNSVLIGIKQITGGGQTPNLISDRYPTKTPNATYAGTVGISNQQNSADLYIMDNRYDYVNSASNFKSWLSTHNTMVYYVLATPTSTEITDTTLISQLEEISKTLSYQGQTNITSNTITIFDVEAYQSTKLILENLDSRLTLVEG